MQGEQAPQQGPDQPQPFTLEKADELTERISSSLNSREINIDEANRLQGIVGEEVKKAVNPEYAAHVASLKESGFEPEGPDPIESEEFFKSK